MRIRFKTIPVVALLLLVLTGCQDHAQLSSMPHAAPVSFAPPPQGGVAAEPGLLLSAPATRDLLATLDDHDLGKERQAERRVFIAPPGQTVTWSNPDTRHAGTLTVESDSYNAQGAYCRQFNQTLTIGGQTRQSVVKACQQADGGWKIAP